MRKSTSEPRTVTRFVASALNPDQLPKSDLPEVAFVGRSNCGKSTLVNSLAQSKKLARTGKRAGLTQTINFFDAGSHAWVDLPGYGFSRRESALHDKWYELVKAYFERPKLKLVLFLSDIRRPWADEDIDLIRFIAETAPTALVLTKADKISRGDRSRALDALAHDLEVRGVALSFGCTVSGMKGEGVRELREAVQKSIS